METPWIATDHAADFAAEIVARLGRPLSPAELSAAERVVGELGGENGMLVGRPAALASTMAAAISAVEAHRIPQEAL